MNVEGQLEINRLRAVERHAAAIRRAANEVVDAWDQWGRVRDETDPAPEVFQTYLGALAKLRETLPR